MFEEEIEDVIGAQGDEISLDSADFGKPSFLIRTLPDNFFMTEIN